MHPIDLATDDVFAFLYTALPEPPARVLEVGCGRGEVAARLQTAGFEVVALDRDAEAVQQAGGHGVRAVEGDFLRYEDAPYDAVVFTRSLHHIHPLADAVAHAHALLRTGGAFVADEFAREVMDHVTASWYFDTRALLEAADIIPDHDDHGDGHDDPLTRWHARFMHHDHEPLHMGAAMIEAIERCFGAVEVATGSYLYRSLAEHVEDTDRGTRVVEQLREIERRRIGEGSLVAVGLRLVAYRRKR